MSLIETYLYHVTKGLPGEERAEVERELQADIESMLPENHTEADVLAALEQLGDPELLADEYRGEKRYLIGPALYGTYIKILKLVGSIVIIIGICAVFIDAIQGLDEGVNVVGLFVNLAVGIAESCVGAFFTVTVIFAVLERFRVAEASRKKKWTPDRMEEIPDKGKSCSRAGAVAGIVIGIVFLLVLSVSPQLLGVHIRVNGELTLIPLFTARELEAYYPAIFLLVLAAIAVGILKLVTGRWTGKLAALNTAYNALFALVLALMLLNESLFNPEFLARIAAIFDAPLERVLESWRVSSLAVIGIIVLASAYDSFDGIRKSRL